MPAKPAKSNIALLTEGQSYIQRAKKARREQIEEIKFDDETRREWLIGFSKRKKARTDEKRSRAKERDHLAHLDERRKARQELRERAAQNVKDMRQAMGLPDLEDDVEGDSEAGPSAAEEEQEYSDENQVATITITEDFDPASFIQSAQPVRTPDTSTHAPVAGGSMMMPASSHKSQLKIKREREKQKVEKEKSRSMETKAERKKGREMEARRRTKKAAIAIERDGKQRGRISGRGRGESRGRGGNRGRGGSRGRGKSNGKR